MKILILVRHAKSSWDDPNLADIDRPLNKRGKKDAPEMGQRLKSQDIMPDLIVNVVPQWFKNVGGVNQQAELLLSLADVHKKGETVTGKKGLFQLTRHRPINQGSGGFKNVQVIVNDRGDTDFVRERHDEPPLTVSSSE